MPLDSEETEHLRRVFGALSTAELRRAVEVEHASYLPDALALAREELSRRPPPEVPPPAPVPGAMVGPAGSVMVAACSRHLDRAAITACANCGSYVCDLCVEPGTPLCRPCSARIHPLRHEPFSYAGALQNGSRLFFRCFGKLAVLSVVAMLPWLAFVWGARLTYLGSPYLWYTLYEGSVGLIAIIACLLLLAGAGEGRRLGLGPALLRALRLWPRVCGVSIIAGMKVLLYSLALIVPGLIEATRLTVVLPAATLETGDAMERSHALVGRSPKTAWTVFGLVATALVVTWMAAGIGQGILALVLSAIPGYAAHEIAVVTSHWLGRTVRWWFYAVVLAAYFGLDATARAEPPRPEPPPVAPPPFAAPPPPPAPPLPR